MIALHSREREREMYRQQRESFGVRVRSLGSELDQLHHPQTGVSPSSSSSQKFNFSAMKLFDRFRKIVLRFVFSVPPKRVSQATARSCDEYRPDQPPKTSCCSSYYSSNSHYDEAVADCIEFFNKSKEEGGRKSDAMVWWSMNSLMFAFFGFSFVGEYCIYVTAFVPSWAKNLLFYFCPGFFVLQMNDSTAL